MSQTRHDFVVIGGGIVGASIAEGLARRGKEVAILDEGDVAIRAARGNLGNVWVQGKGVGKPEYADLTRQAGLDWKALAQRLQQQTGIDLHYRNPGAVFLCFSEAELEKRATAMAKAETGTSVASPYEMLDQQALKEIFPMIGSDVVGGSFSSADGTANPLFLLRALIKSACNHGATYQANHGVSQISHAGDGFILETKNGTISAGHIVLCAGLGNAKLSPQLGMYGGVRPVRGQIMVTERLNPFLPYGTNFIRQTFEGGCLMGESSEEAGFDEGTTTDILRSTADKAIRAFPHLKHARIVRAWSALRIMTADGVPVYQLKGFGPDQRSKAAVVSVHSGVSLAPFHCESLAEQIADHALLPDVANAFNAERFNV